MSTPKTGIGSNTGISKLVREKEYLEKAKYVGPCSAHYEKLTAEVLALRATLAESRAECERLARDNLMLNVRVSQQVTALEDIFEYTRGSSSMMNTIQRRAVEALALAPSGASATGNHGEGK